MTQFQLVSLIQSEPIYETDDVFARLEQLEAEMKTAVIALAFERAAILRDQIQELREQLEVA
jgi:excinuclease UvrABC helicase subunit UvrB